MNAEKNLPQVVVMLGNLGAGASFLESACLKLLKEGILPKEVDLLVASSAFLADL